MKLEKVTNAREAGSSRRLHGRRYADACGAAFALELLGERWALLIMRELMFGPRRFGALRAGLPAISARVLAERLAELEAAGVVRRGTLPPPASVPVYELTEWGYGADEAMLALCRWALAGPGHDPALHLSAAALMMSLRALFRPGRWNGQPLRVGIAIGGDSFVATIADGRVGIAREPATDVDCALAAPDAGPLKRLIYGKCGLDAAEALGLRLTGDRAAASRFVDCFALPDGQ